MPQTPARDFIKAAVVDFRFCSGNARNHANTAWTLVNTGVPTVAKIQPVHGVFALTAVDSAPEQTWMTAAQTAMTFEALISLDMFHLGESSSPADTSALLWGDWKISFVQTYGVGMKSTITLALAFNADGFGGTTYITQDLTVSVYESLLKGSPLHLVVSAQYTAGTTTLEVTTQVNGTYTTSSVVDELQAMVAAPVNNLWDTPQYMNYTYFLRMWNTYQDDADVFADMYREAQKVLPGIAFPTVIPGTITFVSGGGGEE